MRSDPARPRAGRGDERGQASVLLLAVLAVTALVIAGVAHLGTVAAQRASAQAAADAVALAGAAGGEDDALEVAAGNEAELVAFASDDRDVVVTIERRGATATARARWLPVSIP